MDNDTEKSREGLAAESLGLTKALKNVVFKSPLLIKAILDQVAALSFQLEQGSYFEEQEYDRSDKSRGGVYDEWIAGGGESGEEDEFETGVKSGPKSYGDEEEYWHEDSSFEEGGESGTEYSKIIESNLQALIDVAVKRDFTSHQDLEDLYASVDSIWSLLTQGLDEKLPGNSHNLLTDLKSSTGNEISQVLSQLEIIFNNYKSEYQSSSGNSKAFMLQAIIGYGGFKKFRSKVLVGPDNDKKILRGLMAGQAKYVEIHGEEEASKMMEDSSPSELPPTGVGDAEPIVTPDIPEFSGEMLTESDKDLLSGYVKLSRTSKEEYAKFFAPRKDPESVSIPPSVDANITAYDKFMSVARVSGEDKKLYEDIPGVEDRPSFYEFRLNRNPENFLNFEGSVFYNKFQTMEEAAGLNIIEGSNSESLLLEVDQNKIDAIKEILDKEVALIVSMANDAFQKISGRRGVVGVSELNVTRRFLIKKIDYLFASIRDRDQQVTAFLNKNYSKYVNRDIIEDCLAANFYLSKEGNLLANDELGRQFADIIVKLIKPNLRNGVFEAYQEVRYLGKRKISWETEGLSTMFGELLNETVSKKILENIGSEADKNVSESLFGISGQILLRALDDRAFYKTSVKRILNTCSVCGKKVYRKYFVDASKSGKELDESEAAEVVSLQGIAEDPTLSLSFEQYSLVRAGTGGGIISLNDLLYISDEGGARERSFAIDEPTYLKLQKLSDSMGLTGSKISTDKTWREIEADFYSGNYYRNVEGTIRKHLALKALGGKYLGSTNISTAKLRCPFGGGEDPASKKFERKDLLAGIEINVKKLYEVLGKNETHIRVISDIVERERGNPAEDIRAYIDTIDGLTDEQMTLIESILRGNEGSEVTASSGPFACGLKREDNIVAGMQLYLQDSVDSGAITEEQMSSLTQSSLNEKAGGFRFSSRSFVCPTEIEVSNNAEEALEQMKKFKLFGMPIASWSTSDEGDAPDGPAPLNPIANAVNNNEKILRLYCGHRTSISRFERVKFADKIRELIEVGNEDNYHNLINSMIDMGVDPSDILPFTLIKQASIEAPPESFALDDFITDGFIGRAHKISSLLKTAMAARSKKTKVDQVQFDAVFNFIKDIQLECPNGHGFSINSSIEFANNFIDVNVDRKEIASKDILGKAGRSQLMALLSLRKSPLKRVSGKDSEGLKPYGEYKFLEDKVSNIRFDVPGSDESPVDMHIAYDTGKQLSMYPMPSRFVTIDNVLSEGGIAEAGRIRLKTVSSSNRMSNVLSGDGDSGTMTTALENIADERSKNQDELDAAESDRDLMQALRNGLNRAIKNDTLTTALLQNDIITIQELLTAASAMREQDVSLYGSNTAKELLEEKINSPIFTEELSQLIHSIFAEKMSAEDRELVNQSIASPGSGVSDLNEFIGGAIESIRNRVKEDLGRDPRAFIYSLEGNFVQYLYRIIIGVLISEPIAKYDNQALSADLRGALTGDSARIPVNLGDIESGLSGFLAASKKELDNLSGSVSSLAKAKDINVTELWFGKQMVTAATAFYMAERLSEVYNKFFNENSVKYLGYKPLGNYAARDGIDIARISIDDLLVNIVSESSNLVRMYEECIADLRSSPDAETESEILGKLTSFMQPAQDTYEEVIQELGQIHKGAEYACRMTYYQETALTYLKDRIYQTGREQEPHVKNLLDKVLVNTRNIEISLATPGDGKYSSHFSKFENSHELLPSIYHPILLDKSGGIGGFSKPIYVIKAKELFKNEIHVSLNDSNKAHIFGLDEDLVRDHYYVLMIHQEDSNIISGFMTESEEFLERHSGYAENGWKLYYGGEEVQAILKKMGLKVSAHQNVSAAYHPGTTISEEDGVQIGYENDALGINTAGGMHIGAYGGATPESKFYPPVPGTACGVGITLPIAFDMDETKGVTSSIGVQFCDLPMDVMSIDGSDPFRVNLSDMMMRTPPEKASGILLEIERAHAEFKGKYQKMLSLPGQAERAAQTKKAFQSFARSKMNEYRNLPLNVIYDNASRTRKTSDGKFITDPSISSEKSKGWRGAYIPMVDPVTANALLTKECFSSEYAGHKIYDQDDERSSDIIAALQSFIISSNGYDKLAELMNKFDLENRDSGVRYSNREEANAITGLDLLDPYESLMTDGGKLSRDALHGVGKFELTVEDGTKTISGRKPVAASGTISDGFEKAFDKRLPEWRAYVPPFKTLNVGDNSESGNAGFGVPKLVLEGPLFQRPKMRGLEGVRSRDLDTDILSLSDLSPVIRTRTAAAQSGKSVGYYGYAEFLEKFVDGKLRGVIQFMEEHERDIATQEAYGVYGPKRASYFDSAALFSKVASNIIAKNFIKKSEKYRTNIFEEIMINDEAMLRFLSNLV